MIINIENASVFISLIRNQVSALHVCLEKRLGTTKNRVKSRPASITAGISICNHFWIYFKLNFGPTNNPKVIPKRSWIAFKARDCYRYKTKMIMLLFGHFTMPSGPVIRPHVISLWHRFSLRLPFQKFASSPRQLPAAIASSWPLPVIRRLAWNVWSPCLVKSDLIISLPTAPTQIAHREVGHLPSSCLFVQKVIILRGSPTYPSSVAFISLTALPCPRKSSNTLFQCI